MGVRIFFDAEPSCAQGALGSLEIAWFCEQVSHPLEHQCGNAVAGWRCIVGKRFGTMYEGLVIVRGKEETAGVGIRKMHEHDFEELTCEFELCAVESCLLQLEDSVDEEYVVVEVRVKMCEPVLAVREQLAVAPDLAVDES